MRQPLGATTTQSQANLAFDLPHVAGRQQTGGETEFEKITSFHLFIQSSYSLANYCRRT
jgi:hypothetical protein